MLRPIRLALMLLAPACGATTDAAPDSDLDASADDGAGDDGGGSDGSGGGGSGSGGGDGVGEGLPIDALIDDAAAAWCDAVLRCCDGEDQAWAFAGWREDARIAHLSGRFPPDVTLDAASCTAVVSEAWPELWIGDWLEAHGSGLVGYDGAEADACIAELEVAACGDPVIDAMFDGTCFGSSAPAGGDQQRRVFERTATEGTCVPIADGFGGLYYGSCDPSEAFCCIDAGTGCSPYPVPGDVGDCVPASGLGEACDALPPMQLCETGLECIEGRCEAISYEALALGEACYDSSNFSLLGLCEDSWCDLFGSAACEPLKADGDACFGGEECVSGYCDPASLTCAVDDTCDG